MDMTEPTHPTPVRKPQAKRRLRTIAFQPRADEAWKRFARELCLAIGALEEDEYLIVSIKRSNRFVQFAGQGSFGMRVEATSSFYLPQEQTLEEAQHARLLGMGWCAPTNLPDQFEPAGQHPPDGSPNYFLDVAAPVPHDALAMLAVDTFTGVFGASHPLDLEYTAFSESGTSIRFPTLGIRRQEART
jgi:hypothetical protein